MYRYLTHFGLRWPLTAVVTAFAGAASAAPTLAIEFVDSPATANAAINAAGDIVGTYAFWPCGSHTQCAPVSRTAVWTVDGTRRDLPTIGSLPIAPAAIADDGQVVGTVSDFATESHAVVWNLVGGSYQLSDIGSLPGHTQAAAAGFDALQRVVGHAAGGADTRPFVWTPAGGFVDLAAAGFPFERPHAVSPAGWVVSDGHTYQLDDPTTVLPLPPAPPGFFPPGGFTMKINDRRELAGFLVATSGQSLSYLHRYRPAVDQWQMLSASPNGNLSHWRIGSIDGGAGVTATVTSVGVVADGPDGVATPVDSRLSPAYPGVSVTDAGPHNGGGRIAALAIIGRSQRLVRLVPTAPCSGACMHVDQLTITGTFINDPKAPGSCTPRARNRVVATLKVTDAAGSPVRGVNVRGRFLDDYALNEPMQGRTDASGQVSFRHLGEACVGAVAFFTDRLDRPAMTFDTLAGTLTGYVIPLP